ncbi:MAG TPA: ABC transporter ATP-binding protein [Pyrinomonadaceae bacterium]|jgi:ATP-binding cassette subfamily B protein|nr:ABC transporter ATP-binding protein [Pyrinomonadaceae bacterium]
MSDITTFKKYLRPYRGKIALGIFTIAVSMIFGLAVPYMVGAAVDDLAAGITWNKIIYYPLAILALNLTSGIFLFLQRRLLINVSRYIEFDMRDDFFNRLIIQPAEFFQSNRVGDLMARATNDLAAIRQIVGPMILYSFQAIFALAITLPILFGISVKLTLLMLLPLPLVSLTVKILGEQIHKRFEKIQEFFADISARAQENISGVRVIRAFAREKTELDKFDQLNQEYARQNLRLVKFAAAMRPMLFFFIGLGFVVIVAVGVPAAIRGEMTAGDFTSFILYLQRMIWYLIALGYVVNLYQRGTASLKRFNSVLSILPTISDSEKTRPQKPIEGEIEFRNLVFSYKNGPKVLDGINLKIEKGKTVAFVGKTGSGKSTLVSLIPRLFDAPYGMVLIDGKPVQDYPLEQLRKAIGFVPQESYLFSDTLAANIAFGLNGQKDKASENGYLSIEAAAEAAGLSEDIRQFPDGFNQIVGERGITLSGGQKQRTSLARALARNPKILILDDALSAVDTYTEEKILSRLREIRKGRTAIIVSHRISTIKDADLICVLKGGKIIESGTHRELVDLGGEYSELYERQQLEEELEAA